MLFGQQKHGLIWFDPVSMLAHNTKCQFGWNCFGLVRCMVLVGNE